MRQPALASEDPSTALNREMHQVGGGLFLVGGALVAAVLFLGSWPDMNRGILAVTAAVALIAGAGLTVLARTSMLPASAMPVLAMLGTLNITATVYAAGSDGAGPFGVLYVFVTVFSFYYFPFRIAAAEVALTAIAYAVVLQFVVVPDGAASWLVVTVANAMIGMLIGRGGKRMRDLLDGERVAIARLHELDELRTAFLRAVSHELRTPLTAVIGNAETLGLRRRQMDELQVDTLIERIGSNGRRLDRLLSNLLDIDRISRGIVQAQTAPTDLSLLVRQVVSEMRTPGHTIDIQVVGSTIVDVEASKVERIVENLVANAIRHTPSGTSIYVDVSEVEQGVVITVSDDGPGVPEELRERIFDAFAQGQDATASPSPGTGIGLSLVAKFAELHGGRAWVEPSTYGGAAFHVHLPGAAADTVAAAAKDEHELSVEASSTAG